MEKYVLISVRCSNLFNVSEKLLEWRKDKSDIPVGTRQVHTFNGKWSGLHDSKTSTETIRNDWNPSFRRKVKVLHLSADFKSQDEAQFVLTDSQSTKAIGFVSVPFNRLFDAIDHSRCLTLPVTNHRSSSMATRLETNTTTLTLQGPTGLLQLKVGVRNPPESFGKSKANFAFVILKRNLLDDHKDKSCAKSECAFKTGEELSNHTLSNHLKGNQFKKGKSRAKATAKLKKSVQKARSKRITDLSSSRVEHVMFAEICRTYGPVKDLKDNQMSWSGILPLESQMDGYGDTLRLELWIQSNNVLNDENRLESQGRSSIIGSTEISLRQLLKCSNCSNILSTQGLIQDEDMSKSKSHMKKTSSKDALESALKREGVQLRDEIKTASTKLSLSLVDFHPRMSGTKSLDYTAWLPNQDIPGPSLFGRTVYFLQFLGFLFLAILSYEFAFQTVNTKRYPSPTAVYLMVSALILHSLHALMRCVNFRPYIQFHGALECVLSPILFIIPFSYAQRIQLDHEFFYLKDALINLFAVLVAGYCFSSYIKSIESVKWLPAGWRIKFSEERYFRLLPEAIFSWIFFLFAWILWRHYRWHYTLIGCCCMLMALSFTEHAMLQTGRLIFYFCILLTEEQVRLPFYISNLGHTYT